MNAQHPRYVDLFYNALDCSFTARVERRQREELDRDDPAERARIDRLYRQHLRTSKVAAEMSLAGFPVNHKTQRRLIDECHKLARDRKQILLDLVAPYVKTEGAFRVTEPEAGHISARTGKLTGERLGGSVNESDLRALIYREAAKPGIESFNLDVPMEEGAYTDTGLPAVNQPALLMLMTQPLCPPELKKIIRAAWQYDAPLKASSTYLDSKHVWAAIVDGRMHSRFNSCAAKTGRWSSSKPNLYNLSEALKEEEGALQGYLPNMRQMYEAPAGYVIVGCDAKALEAEIMAEESGDVALRQAIDSGDVHTTRARLLFSIPEDQPVPKQIRKLGKVGGFLFQYGGGLDTLYPGILKQIPDAPFEDAEMILEALRETHVGIVARWSETVEFAERHGYITTPIMDRRRYFAPDEPIKPTETSNHPVQGCGADIMDGALVGCDEADYPHSVHAKLKRYHPRAWLVLFLYDAFYVICPEREAAGVGHILEDGIAAPPGKAGWIIGKRPHQIRSDTHVGKNWGEV